MRFSLSSWSDPPLSEMTPERSYGIASCAFMIAVPPQGLAAHVLIRSNDVGHAARLRVQLTTRADILEVSRVTGRWSSRQEEGTPGGRALETWLDPGDGRLFRSKPVLPYERVRDHVAATCS